MANKMYLNVWENLVPLLIYYHGSIELFRKHFLTRTKSQTKP